MNQVQLRVPGGLRLAGRAGLPAALAVLGSVLIERIPGPGGTGSGMAAQLSEFGSALGRYLLTSALAAVLSAPVIAVLAGRVRGARPDRSAVAGAVVGAWRLWLAGLFYDAGVTFGLILLVVPGFVLSVVWVLYAPAAVLGGCGPFAALGASVARAHADWGELAKRIAGPFVLYGAVYALAAAPSVFAAVHYVLSVGLGTEGLVRYAEGLLHYLTARPPPPAWFAWGMMPAAFAAARLYLFAGVTSAWLALER